MKRSLSVMVPIAIACVATAFLPVALSQEDKADTYREEGKRLYQEGKYDEALDKVLLSMGADERNPVGDGTDAESAFWAGKCHVMLGQSDNAVEPLYVAAKLNPENPDASALALMVLAPRRETSKMKEIAQRLEAAVTPTEAEGVEGLVPAAQCLIAYLYMGAGSYDEARDAVDLVLQNVEDYVAAYIIKARCLTAKGSTEDACGVLETALDKAPEGAPFIYSALAEACIAAGNLEEARGYIAQAEQGDPVGAGIATARVQKEENNLKDALDDAAIVARNNPDSWRARYEYAVLLNEAGKGESAWDQCYEGLQTPPPIDEKFTEQLLDELIYREMLVLLQKKLPEPTE